MKGTARQTPRAGRRAGVARTGDCFKRNQKSNVLNAVSWFLILATSKCLIKTVCLPILMSDQENEADLFLCCYYGHRERSGREHATSLRVSQQD